MKPKNLFACFTTGLLLAGAVLAARAQESNAPAGNPPTDRRPQPPGGPGRSMEGLGPVAAALTEEQRASMQQAMQAQSEQVRELAGKLRDARRNLFASALEGKFDEAAVRQQAAAVADLEAQLTVLRLKALSQIQPPLSPEQIEKIKSATPAAPPPGARPADRPARRRILSDANRDENDLPPKP